MLLLEHDIDDSPPRRLSSPGKCIYCGVSGVKLTDEHVVPFAIGRHATILEKSCCEICQKIIQPYEQEVLRKQLGVFRAMVDAPSRNKRDRPTEITLPLVEIDDHGQIVRDLGSRSFPIEVGPLILSLWQSPPPRVLGEPVDPKWAQGREWQFVEGARAEPLLKPIAEEFGLTQIGVKLPAVNRLHYLRSLAKSAHAYAAAELGVDAFEPYLLDLILCRSDDVGEYVGDLRGASDMEGPSGHSFKIGLGQIPEKAGDAGGSIAVFMQLWADLGSPPHFIVVGKPNVDMEDYLRKRRDAGKS